jgi:hypothetical protein
MAAPAPAAQSDRWTIDSPFRIDLRRSSGGPLLGTLDALAQRAVTERRYDGLHGPPPPLGQAGYLSELDNQEGVLEQRLPAPDEEEVRVHAAPASPPLSDSQRRAARAIRGARPRSRRLTLAIRQDMQSLRALNYAFNWPTTPPGQLVRTRPDGQVERVDPANLSAGERARLQDAVRGFVRSMYTVRMGVSDRWAARSRARGCAPRCGDGAHTRGRDPFLGCAQRTDAMEERQLC